MEFTPCQTKAKIDILNWVFGAKKTDDDYFATLSGAAGTGKSTLAKYILEEIRYKKRIAVTATTHKAKKVIGDFTGMEARTIQSLLGLRPDIELTDFDPNKPVFDIKAEERIKDYDFILLDEGSMCNEASTDLIMEKAIQYGCMVLFMGDKYQIPPVGEVLSKIFKVKNLFLLETVVRQRDSNPNQSLLLLARNDVRDNTDETQKYLNTIEHDINGDEGFTFLPKEDFFNKTLEYYYDSEYAHNRDFIKTICYTNKAVASVNRFIRKRLIDSKDLVAVGDLLMGYNNVKREVQVPGGFLYESVIENSKDYEVEQVELVEHEILGISLKGYRTTFKDVKKPVFILHRESYPTFIDEFNDRLQKAKQFRAWKSFYNFKEQIILMENVYDDYGGFVCKKDLDYGYALTAHKSQGSTYENVAIALGDINTNRVALERRKLLYVALSRTRKLNIIHNGK